MALLLAPAGAHAAIGDTSGLSAMPDPLADLAQWGPPGPPPGPPRGYPPGRGRGRGRRPRCWVERRRVPVRNRFGRIVDWRYVERRVCS